MNPLDGDPYVQGQITYLDQAIGWARTAGLKVMLDLHGAPGSQNGFDNSGRYGPIDWQSGNNVPETLTAIQNLADRYASQTDVVTAIELINEPANWGLDMSQVKQFYCSCSLLFPVLISAAKSHLGTQLYGPWVGQHTDFQP